MLFLTIIITFSLYVPTILSSGLGPRIVNGRDADIKQFPFIVSIRYAKSKSHFCGGTIISKKWILTAAHCFLTVKSAKDMDVQYGVTVISTDNHNVVPVSKYYSHKKFRNMGNDIGLIKLKKSLKFGPTVKRVTLAKPHKKLKKGADAILFGWGLNATHGVVQKHLKYAHLKVMGYKTCRKKHGSTILRTNFCVTSNSNTGQCSGDSGGPLVADKVQIGIVSWSVKPCGKSKLPGVMTKVSKYIKWIKKKTKTKIKTA